jgi:hypothetical protein
MVENLHRNGRVTVSEKDCPAGNGETKGGI